MNKCFILVLKSYRKGSVQKAILYSPTLLNCRDVFWHCTKQLYRSILNEAICWKQYTFDFVQNNSNSVNIHFFTETLDKFLRKLLSSPPNHPLWCSACLMTDGPLKLLWFLPLHSNLHFQEVITVVLIPQS